MEFTKHLLAALMHSVEGRGENPILAVTFVPGGNGMLPHGVVAYDRGDSPFGPDHTYVVHPWSYENGSIALGNGRYDLTRAEAWAEFIGHTPAY